MQVLVLEAYIKPLRHLLLLNLKINQSLRRRRKPKAKAPAPAPTPAPKKDEVTLKPLVNNKGKVVGMGHFKGDDKQDTKAIPKKAPSTPAAKAKLKEAVAKTTTPIAKVAQKAQSKALAPKPKPKAKTPAPAPKPVASDKVTLKPLVNKKGKVVGMGHYKGNESQDLSKIPKKAPSTPAAKAQLKAAVAKTPTPIAKSAVKKQKEVLATKPKPKPKATAPAPKAPADAKVTLKPLVNKKGKTIGLGHFKGNETQDRSAIPKKAPSTPAAKANLLDAISKTTTPVTKAAQSVQNKVLPAPKLGVARAKSAGITDPASLQNIAKASNPLKAAGTSVKRKAVLTKAIDDGIHPTAAAGIGLMKNPDNAQKKVDAALPYATSELGKVDPMGQINIMKQPVGAKTGGSNRDKLTTVGQRAVNKEAAIRGAVAGGVDPAVAGSLGLVKKIP